MALQLPQQFNQMSLANVDQAVQNKEWNALRMEGEGQRQEMVGQEFDKNTRIANTKWLAAVAQDVLDKGPGYARQMYPKMAEEGRRRGIWDDPGDRYKTQSDEELMNGFNQMYNDSMMGLAGLETEDPKLAKDAAGFQRFAGGDNFGERAFPDAEAPAPGTSGGVTGSLQELNAINEDRASRGEDPMQPEVYLKDRRRSSADMQAYSQYVIDAQRAGTQVMSENEFKQAREGGIAASKTTESELAQRALDVPSAFALHSQTTQNFTRLYDAVTTLEANEDLWKAVGLAQSMALIPGQDGADVRAAITNIKSQVGFMVLQDMRNASKTGGALGQVSEKENELLQANLAALDVNMSPKAFRQSLKTIQNYLTQAQARLNQSWQLTYPELNTMGQPRDEPYTPGTGQTVDIAPNDPPTMQYDAQGNRVK